MKKIKTVLTAFLVTVAIGLGVTAVANRPEPATDESLIESKVETKSTKSTLEAEDISWPDDDC